MATMDGGRTATADCGVHTRGCVECWPENTGAGRNAGLGVWEIAGVG